MPDCPRPTTAVPALNQHGVQQPNDTSVHHPSPSPVAVGDDVDDYLVIEQRTDLVGADVAWVIFAGASRRSLNGRRSPNRPPDPRSTIHVLTLHGP